MVELAKALSRHPAVHRVDLLTRLIRDPGVGGDYGRREELLAEGATPLGGARIVRVAAGPADKYIRRAAGRGEGGGSPRGVGGVLGGDGAVGGMGCGAEAPGASQPRRGGPLPGAPQRAPPFPLVTLPPPPSPRLSPPPTTARRRCGRTCASLRTT